MALMIIEGCITCGACMDECPNEAITKGDDMYVINPELCTECVGFFYTYQCNEVCPTKVCVQDPDRVEIEAELFARAQQYHDEKEFPAEYPSHFRAEQALASRGDNYDPFEDYFE